eukprot:TRINITY_DN2277_c0_g1_i2.p1 TRINITY_DN2277_c0_g1~~TRINITY_DN2277_c0_g1_i2.p1  ORF type:complete len:524 (+),score=80.78 TRINITY_DN2277_c0_g1_i2:586-2157(+)
MGLAPEGYRGGVIGMGKYSCGIVSFNGICLMQNVIIYPQVRCFSTQDTHIFGAGINFETKEVFFTLNGTLLVSKTLPPLESSDDRLYPSISLGEYESSLSFNFGAKSFEFDIIDYALSQRTDFREYDKIEYPVFDLFDSNKIYRDISKDYRKGYEDKFEILDSLRGAYSFLLFFDSHDVINECKEKGSETNPDYDPFRRYLAKYQDPTGMSSEEVLNTLCIHSENIFMNLFLNIIIYILDEIKIMRMKRTFSPGIYGDMFVNLQLIRLYRKADSLVFHQRICLYCAKVYQKENRQKLKEYPLEFSEKEVMTFFFWHTFFQLFNFLEMGGFDLIVRNYEDFEDDHVFIKGSPVSLSSNFNFKLKGELAHTEEVCIRYNIHISYLYALDIDSMEDQVTLTHSYEKIIRLLGDAKMKLARYSPMRYTSSTALTDIHKQKTIEHVKKIQAEIDILFPEYALNPQQNIDPEEDIDPVETLTNQTSSAHSREKDLNIGKYIIGIGFAITIGGLGYMWFRHKGGNDEYSD